MVGGSPQLTLAWVVQRPYIREMCNDYEQHVRWVDYLKMMQALELGIPSRQSEHDLPQADDIRINDIGPVMRAAGSEIELAAMTFSFPPGRPGGAPVFNFRSEGRHFANSNRCLIPASAFFEFTGKKYPKAKHRFALKGSPITAIAGLWKEAQGNQPPTFRMLTTAPGPDVIPYHNRQVVVLRPEEPGSVRVQRQFELRPEMFDSATIKAAAKKRAESTRSYKWGQSQRYWSRADTDSFRRRRSTVNSLHAISKEH
jgi:putative SOS response-associated peptidase YedK